MIQTLEVRYGREAKMYTLWKSIITDTGYYNEYFIKNLSTEFDKAVSKAEEYGKGVCEVVIDAPEDLNDIVRGDDVFRFGKYKDKRVSEVTDIKYLNWVFDGCRLPDKEDGIWYATKATNDPLVVHVKEHMLSIGEAVLYNDKIITLKHYDRIMNWNKKAENSNFVGSVGERITLENVRVESIKEINMEYGYNYNSCGSTIYLYTFIDNNNNIIITKRSSVLSKPAINKCVLSGKEFDKKYFKNLINIGVDGCRMHTIYSMGSLKSEEYNDLKSFDFSNFVKANFYDKKEKTAYLIESTPYQECILKKDDVVTIIGTIKKHDIYNDAKQTVLNRVNVL